MTNCAQRSLVAHIPAAKRYGKIKLHVTMAPAKFLSARHSSSSRPMDLSRCLAGTVRLLRGFPRLKLRKAGNAEHRAILEARRAKDIETAAHMLKEHLARSSEHLFEMLTSDTQGSESK